MLLAGAFVPIGCQSTPTTEAALVDPSKIEDPAELARAGKKTLQAAIAAFFDDEWDQVVTLGEQMVGLARRWQEQAPREGDAAALTEHATGYATDAGELVDAAKKHDVNGTLGALRKIAAHLAALEPTR